MNDRKLLSGQSSHINHELEGSVCSSRSDSEAVIKTSRKGVTSTVLNVCDIERTGMLLLVHQGSNSSTISSFRDHDGASHVKTCEALDLLGLEIVHEGVGRLDQGIRISVLCVCE